MNCFFSVHFLLVMLGKVLFKIAWQIDPRLSPITISSEAFNKDTWVPLIHEIKQKGIEIDQIKAANGVLRDAQPL